MIKIREVGRVCKEKQDTQERAGRLHSLSTAVDGGRLHSTRRETGGGKNLCELIKGSSGYEVAWKRKRWKTREGVAGV